MSYEGTLGDTGSGLVRPPMILEPDFPIVVFEDARGGGTVIKTIKMFTCSSAQDVQIDKMIKMGTSSGAEFISRPLLLWVTPGRGTENARIVGYLQGLRETILVATAHLPCFDRILMSLPSPPSC